MSNVRKIIVITSENGICARCLCMFVKSVINTRTTEKALKNLCFSGFFLFAFYPVFGKRYTKKVHKTLCTLCFSLFCPCQSGSGTICAPGRVKVFYLTRYHAGYMCFCHPYPVTRSNTDKLLNAFSEKSAIDKKCFFKNSKAGDLSPRLVGCQGKCLDRFYNAF